MMEMEPPPALARGDDESWQLIEMHIFHLEELLINTI